MGVGVAASRLGGMPEVLPVTKWEIRFCVGYVIPLTESDAHYAIDPRAGLCLPTPMLSNAETKWPNLDGDLASYDNMGWVAQSATSVPILPFLGPFDALRHLTFRYFGRATRA